MFLHFHLFLEKILSLRLGHVAISGRLLQETFYLHTRAGCSSLLLGITVSVDRVTVENHLLLFSVICLNRYNKFLFTRANDKVTFGDRPAGVTHYELDLCPEEM